MDKTTFTEDDIGETVLFEYKNGSETAYHSCVLKAITADGLTVRVSFSFFDLEYLFGGGWYPVRKIRRLRTAPDPKQKKLPYREFLNE